MWVPLSLITIISPILLLHLSDTVGNMICYCGISGIPNPVLVIQKSRKLVWFMVSFWFRSFLLFIS